MYCFLRKKRRISIPVMCNNSYEYILMLSNYLKKESLYKTPPLQMAQDSTPASNNRACLWFQQRLATDGANDNRLVTGPNSHLLLMQTLLFWNRMINSYFHYASNSPFLYDLSRNTNYESVKILTYFWNWDLKILMSW